MEEAQRLCDRVGIMDHGRLLALDTVHGLIGELGGKTQLTVEDGDGERHIQTDDPVAEIKRIMNEGELHGMRIEPPSLESVFLSLTGRSLRD
jgi:ABC-2 type transport system ATP-binding protein